MVRKKRMTLTKERTAVRRCESRTPATSVQPTPNWWAPSCERDDLPALMNPDLQLIPATTEGRRNKEISTDLRLQTAGRLEKGGCNSPFYAR